MGLLHGGHCSWRMPGCPLFPVKTLHPVPLPASRGLRKGPTPVPDLPSPHARLGPGASLSPGLWLLQELLQEGDLLNQVRERWGGAGRGDQMGLQVSGPQKMLRFSLPRGCLCSGCQAGLLATLPPPGVGLPAAERSLCPLSSLPWCLSPDKHPIRD